MAKFYPAPGGGTSGPQQYIEFDTNGYDPGNGQISWDADFETLQVGLNGVNLQVGQEHVVRVKNNTVSEIADGTVVMFTGSTGDTVTVAPAVSDGTYPAYALVGVATEAIAADGFGLVTQYGFVNQIKTDYTGWIVGTLLYADPSTPGALTNTAPSAPAWDFPIAAVTRVQAESGRILVRAIPSLGNATIINTDGDPGTKIYVGTVDPSTIYTLEAGDVWIDNS